MTKKEIVKITDIIMGNSSKYDAILFLKKAFPKLVQEIDQEVKRHKDLEYLEDAVFKKAEDLFVQDGNERMHFCLLGSRHHTKYFKKARDILDNPDLIRCSQ